jgi:hypothetical protein
LVDLVDSNTMTTTTTIACFDMHGVGAQNNRGQRALAFWGVETRSRGGKFMATVPRQAACFGAWEIRATYHQMVRSYKKRLFLLLYDTQIFHVCIPLSPNTTSNYRPMRSHVLLVNSNATIHRLVEHERVDSGNTSTVKSRQSSSLCSRIVSCRL